MSVPYEYVVKENFRAKKKKRRQFRKHILKFLLAIKAY